MTSAFQRFAAVWFTPVKCVLAVLSLTVVVALSSDEAVGSANNPVCCGGPFNPFPPFYPPYIPPVTPPAAPPAPSTATPQNATVNLTKVGLPIWKVADFQLFSAPASPYPDQFLATLDKLLPLEGPGAATYTPHSPPYTTELSANAATAGLITKSVFPKNAITLNPNAVYFAMMMLPDPGVTGSSRDFSSGAVIPNSIFPMTSNVDMYRNGALVDRLLGADSTVNPRAGDTPYTGASHRAPSVVVWHPWDDDMTAPAGGAYDLKWSLIDVQGNGWNLSVPFQVTPEPTALAIGAIGVIGVVAVNRRRRSSRESR